MDNDAPTDVELKLSAARTKLIIDKPFLGALVLRLPMIKADPRWCKRTATDAKSFYYNEKYINSLSLEQTQFILAHEALHCALSHFARRVHRIKHRWDLACDFAINPMLMKDGLTPPPESLYLKAYEGMTAEEIYPLLEDNDNKETQDQHVYDDSDESGDDLQGNDDDPLKEVPKEKPKSDPDKSKEGEHPPKDPFNNKPDENGEGDQQSSQQSDSQKKKNQGDSDSGAKNSEKAPPLQNEQANQHQDNLETKQESDRGAAQPKPLNHDERENLNVQWKQRMAGAAQSAMQAGKLGDDMARMIDFLLQPELPWRNLLAQYMTSIARDDYSYARPNSRRGDPAIFPSLRSAQINIVVALDTSGSIANSEIREFVSEIDAIKSLMRAQITLHTCDSSLNVDGPWRYEAWDEFKVPEKITGGGGTSFKPVFEWAEQQDMLPDLLVYFTDAEGDFPDYEPNFPVIWLVKGKTKVPFGNRVQLN
ncbi:hypothetical protein MNBD_GAMMA23-554 [hydrothermal vent metagenome]|uniref:Sll7028 protein n=1 Tax=hydrothermal vent metagenome TaxID=652676 RepID=A0A3B0ZWG3_9ZZZZ